MSTTAGSNVTSPKSLDASELYEIVNGERKEIAPMGIYANILATCLATVINTFAVPKRLALAINETLHKLSEQNSRRPDVSVIRIERLPPMLTLEQDPAEFQDPPDLAVEIISPTTTATV